MSNNSPSVIFEPTRGKTNNVVSEQVRHKSGCTSTEDGQRLEILAQVHYKTKIVRCSNVLMCMVNLLIIYYCVWLLTIMQLVMQGRRRALKSGPAKNKIECRRHETAPPRKF